MTAEVERKFVVSELPSGAALGTGVRMRQGYLAQEGTVEVRLRSVAGATTLTIKIGSGLTRIEVELQLPPGDADQLWPGTAGRRVEKVRHRVDVPGGVAEVDIYQGALTGLIVAEVELESVNDAERFTPPAWFGPEVTGVSGWSNAALARDGAPPPPGAA